MTSAQFWSGWWWPAATAVLGFVFAGLVFAQWIQRRKMHQLCWSIGLLMYSVAAAMEAYSEFAGYWNQTEYRIYIVLAASLVGFLGAGSYYLLAKKRIGPDIFLGYIIGCFLVFLLGALTAPLNLSALVPGVTVGGTPLGAATSFPRYMSFFFNIPGSIFLLGGAVISIWRFSRKKEYAYRMWANVLIAAGTVVIAAVGSRAHAGANVGLYPAEMVASALLLAGFLMAGTLDKGARAVREQRKAAAAAAEDPAPGSAS